MESLKDAAGFFGTDMESSDFIKTQVQTNCSKDFCLAQDREERTDFDYILGDHSLNGQYR
jgi:spore germination cell wall hydrolase CwlJ-like protein